MLCIYNVYTVYDSIFYIHVSLASFITFIHALSCSMSMLVHLWVKKAHFASKGSDVAAPKVQSFLDCLFIEGQQQHRSTPSFGSICFLVFH